ncbi:endoribonuclease L-PSP protein [Toxoplasma gondii p89]|uniref:Endoribonuclease L-PSP protein n=2 Tax=Toxoplasma gondii TaxID=5811 RepID=A0A2G8XTQ2_TOXGO|nr:endoribonuclease L-PSP protein [Toxoplasma gondii p89]PIL98088.1 endoribonuclease L-PSP protein [Toxoplasma gondii COUG]
MGPYSHTGNIHSIVFGSGQIGLDPRTMQLVRGGVKEQTQQCLANGEFLNTATRSPKNSSSNITLLTEMAHFGLVSRVYGQFFSDTFAGHQGTERGSPRNETDNGVAPARAASATRELSMRALIVINAANVTNSATR